jgi:hypothetical protein
MVVTARMTDRPGELHPGRDNRRPDFLDRPAADISREDVVPPPSGEPTVG